MKSLSEPLPLQEQHIQSPYVDMIASNNSLSLTVERKSVWGKQQQQQQQDISSLHKQTLFCLEPHRWNSTFPSSRCATGEGQGQINS